MCRLFFITQIWHRTKRPAKGDLGGVILTGFRVRVRSQPSCNPVSALSAFSAGLAQNIISSYSFCVLTALFTCLCFQLRSELCHALLLPCFMSRFPALSPPSPSLFGSETQELPSWALRLCFHYHSHENVFAIYILCPAISFWVYIFQDRISWLFQISWHWGHPLLHVSNLKLLNKYSQLLCIPASLTSLLASLFSSALSFIPGTR